MTMQVAMLLDKDYCDFTTGVTLHRALRRMAGLVFLLVFWVLEGACQRHGVGGFLLRNTTSTVVWVYQARPKKVFFLKNQLLG